MRVRDIMVRPVRTVSFDDSVESAAAVLTEHNITAAPVVDRDRRVVGMVSEGDLLWHRVPAEATARLRHSGYDTVGARPSVVADVMAREVVTTQPDADVADVAEVMLDRDVRSVPVVDDGELVGIVSRRDILRTIVRTDDVLCQEIQHRFDEYTGVGHRWHATVHGALATIDGHFDDDVERQVAVVLARTVPGVYGAYIAEP